MGIFVIISAILNKVMIFEGTTDADSWVQWYMRELSTAMLVANLTVCFPLILLIYRFISMVLPMEVADLTKKETELTTHRSQKEELVGRERHMEHVGP